MELTLMQWTALEEGLISNAEKLKARRRKMFIPDEHFKTELELNQYSDVNQQLLNDITIMRFRKIKQLKYSL